MTGSSPPRTFLATVVDHYVRHPEHRAEIGTATGLDRLRQEISA